MMLTAAALALGATLAAQTAAVNTLSAADKAAGWRLLFDGTSLDGWRGYRQPAPPDAWKVVNGELTLVGKGGDLITTQQFKDFELSLEWKLPKPGNSGVFFHVVEEGEQAYHSGPEIQIYDITLDKENGTGLTSTGSNYALHAPSRNVVKPAGEWNQLRIVVRGPHVEHWVNGVKLLEYELWSPDWEAKVKASKFVKMPGYGRARTGFIGLQDHGDPIAFRNIKIREIGSQSPTAGAAGGGVTR
jgi:hypothetical protein